MSVSSGSSAHGGHRGPDSTSPALSGSAPFGQGLSSPGPAFCFSEGLPQSLSWLTLSAAAPGRTCLSVDCRDWLDVTSTTDRLGLTGFVSVKAMYGGSLQCVSVAFSVPGSSSSSSRRTIGFHRGPAVAAAGDGGAPRPRSLELSTCVTAAVHRCHSHVCQAMHSAVR